MFRFEIHNDVINMIDEWLCKMFCNDGIGREVKALIALTCWYIWKEMCNIQIGKKALDVMELLEELDMLL